MPVPMPMHAFSSRVQGQRMRSKLDREKTKEELGNNLRILARCGPVGPAIALPRPGTEKASPMFKKELCTCPVVCCPTLFTCYLSHAGGRR